MIIEVGRRYKFIGYKESEGHVDVVSLSEHNIYWARLTRAGHPYNAKELPFDYQGNYIGSSRWQVPNLECELPTEMELGIDPEVEVELDLEIEKELEL